MTADGNWELSTTMYKRKPKISPATWNPLGKGGKMSEWGSCGRSSSSSCTYFDDTIHNNNK
jgi:hypothetical protein